MIGIYKITSPSNRVYIGQSIDIDFRFKAYQRIDCKEQPKLFNSLNKYGVDSHKFDVVIECELNNLNELERYYQDLYSVISKGLNCMLTKANDRSGAHSDESKSKMRDKRKLRVFSEETKRKISASHKGKKFTIEHKINLGKAKKGVFAGDKNPMFGKVGAMTGKSGVLSPTWGMKITDAERKRRSERFKGGKNPFAKKVIDTETNLIFDCIRDASEYYNRSYDYLKAMLGGSKKNTSTLIYL